MKNKTLLQLHVTEELDRFLCQEAAKDGRTRAGLVRRWLELISAGKIKVDTDGN